MVTEPGTHSLLRPAAVTLLVLLMNLADAGVEGLGQYSDIENI
jgi:hypothetical protein